MKTSKQNNHDNKGQAFPEDDTTYEHVNIKLIIHKNYPHFRVLKAFRGHYQEIGSPDFLAMPYTVMCAVYLEAALNDALYEFVLTHYETDTVTIANAFMAMSLSNKLLCIAPILTKNMYTINKEHDIYRKLISLIRLRNSLVHPKPIVSEIKCKYNDIASINEDMKKHFSEMEFTDKDLTLGSSKIYTPIEYHDALESFERSFLKPNRKRLTKNKLFIRQR